MKSFGLIEELPDKLHILSQVGVCGIFGGVVECVDIKRNVEGEDSTLDLY